MTQKTERHVEDALKVEATLRSEGRHYEADRIVAVIRSLRSAQAMVTRVTRETEAAVLEALTPSPDDPAGVKLAMSIAMRQAAQVVHAKDDFMKSGHEALRSATADLKRGEGA